MRYILFLLTLLPFLVLSCKSDDISLDNTCNIENPIEDLSWLKERIADIEQSSLTDAFYISQATYEGKTVFIVGNYCANCNSISPVYNCEGERINTLGCSEEFIDFSILNQDTIIWNSENFICNDSDIPLCE